MHYRFTDLQVYRSSPPSSFTKSQTTTRAPASHNLNPIFNLAFSPPLTPLSLSLSSVSLPTCLYHLPGSLFALVYSNMNPTFLYLPLPHLPLLAPSTCLIPINILIITLFMDNTVQVISLLLKLNVFPCLSVYYNVL